MMLMLGTYVVSGGRLARPVCRKYGGVMAEPPQKIAGVRLAEVRMLTLMLRPLPRVARESAMAVSMTEARLARS